MGRDGNAGWVRARLWGGSSARDSKNDDPFLLRDWGVSHKRAAAAAGCWVQQRTSSAHFGMSLNDP